VFAGSHDIHTDGTPKSIWVPAAGTWRAFGIALLLLLAVPTATRAETIAATDTGNTAYAWAIGYVATPCVSGTCPNNTYNIAGASIDDPSPFGDYLPVLTKFCKDLHNDVPFMNSTFQPYWNATGCNAAVGASQQVNPAPVEGGLCQAKCNNFAIGYFSSVHSHLRRLYTCPAGQNWTLFSGTCTRPDCNPDEARDAATGQCLPTPGAKQLGSPPEELCQGNPINAGTGTKYHEEEIYRGAGTGALAYRLHYSSRSAADSAAPVFSHGPAWQSTYDRQLIFSPDWTTNAGPSVVRARSHDGKLVEFRRQADGSYAAADADITRQLVRVVDGSGTNTLWRIIDTVANIVETYSGMQAGAARQGKLAALTEHRTDLTAYLLVTGNKVSDIYHSVTGYVASGYKLHFAYDAQNRVSTLTQPDGGIVGFAYDAAGRLSTITWPGGARVRNYLYEDANFPNNLTGITDENGDRYATWTYDSQGRAFQSQHGGGVDLTTLDYGASGTTVTDAIGTVRTYGLTTVLGVVRGTGASQPAGAGCGPASSAAAYDANGNVASRTDFNGNTTTYSYNLARNLETSRTEAFGTAQARTISTEWHAYWRLPVKIAEPKKLTTYIYNGDGGVTCAPLWAILNSMSSSQRIGVLCQRTEQATTDDNGGQGLSPTVTGSARTWSYTYDDYGQMLTANGPRTDLNDVTTYTYHPTNDASRGRRGNIATISNALGHVTQITAYDANGRPLTIIDPNGVTLAFTYTPRGWLQTSSVAGQTTTYAYDGVGQLTGLTRPDSSQISYDYDPAHRLIGIGDGAGNRVEFTLDALGNITHTAWVNPDSTTAQSRSATFDALGRLHTAIATRNAVSHTTTYGHDAKGNPSTVTDAKGNLTTTQYDALDRPTRITDALLGLTTLAYDARGQLTQFQAPNNAQTSFTVDGLGNVTAEASADRGSLTATYDAAGNLLTLADARGITESHTYDALNRPLTVTYPTTGENLTYTWDSFAGCANGIGRLCRIADNGGSTTFSYDVRGNPISKTRSEAGGSFSTQFAFDGADRVNTVITPTGKVLTVQRDVDGRIQQLSTAVGATPQVNLVSAVQQNAAGNTVAQTFGNGVTEARSYAEDGLAVNAAVTEPASGGGGEIGGDGDVPTLPEWGMILLGALLLGIGYRKQNGGTGWPGRLAGVILTTLAVLPLLAASPVALANETLTYDANGNIQTRTLSGGTTTYGYDALDRINSEAGPAKTQSLTYDPNDNRLTDGTGSKTYSPNSDRIVTENGQTFSLDAAGNVTQARGLNFVWNQRAAQVKTVSQGGTLLATYYYDYQGLRSRKVTTAAAPQGAGTVIYHYDLQGRLIAETTPQGTPLFTYVWRDDVPVSIIVHGTPETALYLETDHLNTPIAARDQAGKVVWKWESDAFGATLPNEDPDGDSVKVTINLRFPGQYFDKESGLHYNWNRYYDPKLGRYLSPDPIGLAGGRNLYTYVGGNPVSYADPAGLCPWCAAAGLGAVIGGAAGGVTAALKGQSARDIVVATVLGAGAGATAGITLGTTGSLVVGGLSSGTGNLIGQLVSGSGVDGGEIATSVLAGTTGGGAALLARAAGYGIVAEAGIGGLAGAEMQAMFDIKASLEKRFPTRPHGQCTEPRGR
jgi:RHS repeat-associated protein